MGWVLLYVLIYSLVSTYYIVADIFCYAGTDDAARVIHAPVIESGVGDAAHGHGDQWFLAPRLVALAQYDLLWIHIKGARHADGDPQSHMGKEFMSYPSLRCHVFLRDASYSNDPVDGASWARQDNLQGHSVFLGINYPFFFEAPANAKTSAEQVLPLFKPDCVFATDMRARDQHLFPPPSPHWSRMQVNGGPAIGSRLKYAESYYPDYVQAPMWFMPTLPPVIPEKTEVRWKLRSGLEN